MPAWFHRELSLGSVDPAVALIRRKLGLPPSEIYDIDVELHVRAVQKQAGLPTTGVVDEATADAIGDGARYGLVPEWFTRPLRLGDTGEDVAEARHLLGLARTPLFDAALDAQVRRFQSRNRIVPDGVIDRPLAVLIGDDVPSF